MVQSQKTLTTIWQVSDELWNKLKQILPQYDPPNRLGRKRINARAAIDAVIFRLKSGCQWNHLQERISR
jgi:transposase